MLHHHLYKYEIAMNVDVTTLSSLYRTDKEYNSILRGERFWKERSKRDFVSYTGIAKRQSSITSVKAYMQLYNSLLIQYREYGLDRLQKLTDDCTENNAAFRDHLDKIRQGPVSPQLSVVLNQNNGRLYHTWRYILDNNTRLIPDFLTAFAVPYWFMESLVTNQVEAVRWVLENPDPDINVWAARNIVKEEDEQLAKELCTDAHGVYLYRLLACIIGRDSEKLDEIIYVLRIRYNRRIYKALTGLSDKSIKLAGYYINYTNHSDVLRRGLVRY